MKEESTVGGARKETKPKHNRLSLIMKCLVLYGAYHREQFFFASSPVHLNSGLSPNTFKQKLKTYLLPRIGKRHTTPLVSDMAVFVVKSNVKLQLTTTAL